VRFDPSGVDVALRDGRTVHVRPARPADAAGLQAFLERLPERDRYFRFFSVGVNLPAAARSMAQQPDGLGLLALAGADERVVGHATYMPETASAAEVAFAIDPAWQGHGLATTLMAELAEAAAGDGIVAFTAVVMPENHRMVNVFRHSGFAVEVRSLPGEIEVTFATEPTQEGRARFAERERAAAVQAVRHVLEPASYAVVGPEDDPDGADLVVLAVPAAGVLAAAAACGAAGTRALVVRAALDDGADLLRLCRGAGMRLVGPESLGVADPRRGLHAIEAPPPPEGRVAFASQGGAFGLAAIELGRVRGVGLSSFVSLGTKADLSGNDFLQFWEQDDGTDVVLLYLESFGNPRKFGRVTRRMTARKPVVALKSGRRGGEREAGGSRCGALLAAADTSVDALFEHAGVIRAESPAEMFDVAALLVHEPLPAGRRVAVVATERGPAAMGADACAAAGLDVTDCVTVPAAEIGGALDRDADAVIVVHVPSPGFDAAGVAAAIRARAAPAVPVLGAFIGSMPMPPPGDGERLPIFGSVEAASRALARVSRYADHLRAPHEDEPPPDGIDPDRAAGIIAAGLAAGGGWLGGPAAEALLAAYGIPLTAPAPPGPQLIAGVVGDPEFGPLAVVAGGPAAELVRDVQVGLAPVGVGAAERLVRGLRTFPLLDGFRGAPHADVAAVADVVARVAALAAAHPEIAELDCDPLVAGPDGAVVAGARVRLAAAPAARPFGALDR
jgi:acyl-CoA synthetase (NDP forming)/RimJ/RimL family protein N-acetyltransferase